VAHPEVAGYGARASRGLQPFEAAHEHGLQQRDGTADVRLGVVEQLEPGLEAGADDRGRHQTGVVRREHARLYERKRFKTVQVDELVSDESPELAVAEEREVLDMRRAIFALDDDYREPLVMQVLMGFSTDEIARQLGLTQGAVLTRLFRARQRLRRDLGVTGSAEDEES